MNDYFAVAAVLLAVASAYLYLNRARFSVLWAFLLAALSGVFAAFAVFRSLDRSPHLGTVAKAKQDTMTKINKDLDRRIVEWAAKNPTVVLPTPPTAEVTSDPTTPDPADSAFVDAFDGRGAGR